MKRHAVLLVTLLWLLPLCVSARLDTEKPRRLDNGARLDWVPCWFEPAFGEDARCAHFFPSAPAGPPVQAGPAAPAVRLPVVVLRSQLPDTRDSPVLYLPPGPGNAAGLTERAMGQWWHWQGLARWPHDLVLFDVRGAGESRPRLDCPEITAVDRAGLEKPLTAEDDLRALQDSAAKCHRRLRASGVDPRAFSTERQVQDLGELMALLGGNDWNLWGVSYGTRLALHAVREFPERLRSVTLDSAFPPEVNGLLEKPGQFARVTGTLAAICAQDAQCGRDHPQLAAQIAELMRRVAAKPVRLDLEKWPGVWRHRLAVNDYRLLWMLFLETYRPAFRPRTPHAIAQALAGRYEALEPLGENFIETLLDRDFSHGLYWSTVCPEDFPGVTRAAYVTAVQRHPAIARHLLPEWDRHVCHRWDAGRLPERYFAPVTSPAPAASASPGASAPAVPTLFLSGAWDTVTLPEWAARAARGFARGRHSTLAGSSHAVTWENDCAMGMVWEFLGDPGTPARSWATPCVAQATAASAASAHR